MKKTISLILALVMAFSLVSGAIAVNDEGAPEVLRFNEDKTFKIMQLNDIQDDQFFEGRAEKFIKKALEEEKPDLVVIAGDMLSDFFLVPTKKNITTAIGNFCSIINDQKIPFAVTFGNHDHDLKDKMSLEEMAEVYKSFEYCVNADDGCNAGTYNLPVYASDSDDYAMNIYMMDTNNKSDEIGGYEGVYPYQVDWYKEKSDALKQENGGEVVPSMVFQHIPVKEIYDVLEEVDATQSQEAAYSIDDGCWIRVRPECAIANADEIAEPPCSEPRDYATGQYEAWLEKGDIIGAFFGHDHVNNFVARTDDGIVLGYNGGTGFSAYGMGGNRSVRVFEFNEDDVANYTTRSIHYSDYFDECVFAIADPFSPATLTLIFRFFCKLFLIAR